MAQLNLLAVNLKNIVADKAEDEKDNACQKVCDEFPYIVCPCSFNGILELLSGRIHVFVLSLFLILGVATLLYGLLLGWNSTVIDVMIGVAVAGPLWVSCTIATKTQLSGIRSGVIHEINSLEYTNAQLKKKLKEYGYNVLNLQTATSEFTKERKVQHEAVQKSTALRRSLQKEEGRIHSHIVKFEEDVDEIEQRGMISAINNFDKKVKQWLSNQPNLKVAHESFRQSQEDTGDVIEELSDLHQHLGDGVGSIEYLKTWYTDAGNVAKDVVPMLDQMEDEYERFAKLIRLQESSFMRKLAYDIKEECESKNFGIAEYNLFVERLPSYLAHVVHREHLKFKKYTTSRGRARSLGKNGLKRLVNDIVDGASMVDQTEDIQIHPFFNISHLSREFIEHIVPDTTRSNNLWRSFTKNN